MHINICVLPGKYKKQYIYVGISLIKFCLFTPFYLQMALSGNAMNNWMLFCFFRAGIVHTSEDI